MPKHTVKNRSPFAKAIALAIGLVFALFLYSKVKSGNALELFLAFFEDTMTAPTSQSKLTNNERDSLKDLASGFWVYRSDSNDIFIVDDRIEITDNGYIWQVEQVLFTLPSGSKKSMTHVFHGFFYPSSKAVPDSTYINSVIRYLPQMWISEGDTCVITKYFGESRLHKMDDVVLMDYGDFVVGDYKDEAVDVLLDGRSLTMNNRNYVPFGEKEIKKFFPKGLVDKVYNLSTAEDIKSDKMYSVKNKEVILNKGAVTKNVIEVPVTKECTDCFSWIDFLRRAIGKNLQKATVAERSLEEIMKLVQRYYIPFCLKSWMNLALYSREDDSSRISFSFDLTWEGKTENVTVLIQASALDRKMKETEMTMEIEKWKFQPLEKESPPFKVSFEEVIE